MYQTSVRTGKLPSAWKNITAIHKKGNKHVAGNYRPVSLTSIVRKILESIVRDALIKFMKENRLFSERQFVFLGVRPTTLQLLKVLDKWTEVLDMGSYVNVVYWDFMKAFDTVPHGRFIQVPHHYGVDDYLVTWIKGFLTNRRQSCDKRPKFVLVWGKKWYNTGVCTGTSTFCSSHKYNGGCCG